MALRRCRQGGASNVLLFLACWLLVLGVEVGGKTLKDMPKAPDAKGRASYEKWVKTCGEVHEVKTKRQRHVGMALPGQRTTDFQPDYPNFIASLTATTAATTNKNRKTIIVSKDKKAGNFTKVQAAIDSIPANNKERIVIWVQKGVYKEKVTIPSNKPFIHLYGDGMHMSSIEWGDTASTKGKDGQLLGTFKSAAVAVNADYFIASGIAFVNTAPSPPPGAVGKQAVALRISGDKAAFYYVAFYGAQDTLYDHKGRHYFQNCFIQGSIDYIFGNGQSIYQSCRLHSIATSFGSVTAQKRDLKNDTTGFSFIGCTVTGSGMLYLGRAWGVYSRVVYSFSFIEDIIRPEGWYNWGVPAREKTVFYGEYECTGPGSNSSAWPAWARQLTKKQAAPFLDKNTFIDADQWL